MTSADRSDSVSDPAFDAGPLPTSTVTHRQSGTDPRLDRLWVRVLSWTIFPLTLGGAVGAALWQIHDGVAPEAAVILPTALPYFLLLALERAVPLHAAWKKSYGDIHVDLGYLLVSGIATLGVLRPFVVAGSVWLAIGLSDALGMGLWPTDWPLVVQLPLALVAGEFSMYWVHRLAHEWDFLWRFHAAHHSAPRLYFLNAVRFHPVDLAISAFAPMISLIVLGAGGEIIALFGLVSAVHGIFQHANIPIRCGPLNWFFSMAELHRWHHSPDLREANTNYGQNLIVWDIVYGTRFLPKDRTPPVEIGIGDMPHYPMGLFQQLIAPFRWKKTQRESSGPAPPTPTPA